jgi:hypothetical protein
MEKRKVSDYVWGFPNLGGSLQVPVVSKDGSERFIFDLSRGRIKLSKVTYQERYIVEPLVRLDVDGPDHMNPDGKIVPCPHLHTYREGFGTRWAEPCPFEIFGNLSNIRVTLDQFFSYCRVIDPPAVAVGVIP